MKKAKAKVTWKPLHEEALTRRWFLSVALATNHARWRWSVQKRDTHERFKGTRLAQSFVSARGYASTRARARRMAEMAMRAIEHEESRMPKEERS